DAVGTVRREVERMAGIGHDAAAAGVVLDEDSAQGKHEQVRGRVLFRPAGAIVRTATHEVHLDARASMHRLAGDHVVIVAREAPCGCRIACLQESLLTPAPSATDETA